MNPSQTFGHFIADRFDEVCEALRQAGFHRVSDWWKKTIRDWLTSGKRQLVLRVGRRGGKSSTLCALAVTIAVYGQGYFDLPLGDEGVVAIVSVSLNEARKRLRTIAKALDALGVPHESKDETIRLSGSPVVFQTFAASLAGVVGFTALFVLCDEVCRWKDKDTGANPATEVLGSLRPTMATQPNALMVLSSSPLGTLDAHYAAFERGDDEGQMVAWAPTWVANSTLTEADTHRLESDARTHDREYRAIPSSGLSAEYESSQIEAVERDGPLALEPEPNRVYFAAMDPASRQNSFTLAIATATTVDDPNASHSSKKRPFVQVVYTKEWVPPPGGLDLDAVMTEVVDICKSYRTCTVMTDRWSGDALQALARRRAFHIEQLTFQGAAKVELYDQLRVLITTKTIELPADPQVRQDMLGIRRAITESGPAIRLAKVGNRHCDYVPSIAMAAQRAAQRGAHNGPAVYLPPHMGREPGSRHGYKAPHGHGVKHDGGCPYGSWDIHAARSRWAGNPGRGFG